MISLVGEALADKDLGLQPVIISEHSWSTGTDGFVEEDVTTLSELKGKAIVGQKNGPHVAIASRTVVVDEPDVLGRVTGAYFTALKSLQDDPALMKDLARADSGFSNEDSERMLGGIRLANYGIYRYFKSELARQGLLWAAEMIDQSNSMQDGLLRQKAQVFSQYAGELLTRDAKAWTEIEMAEGVLSQTLRDLSVILDPARDLSTHGADDSFARAMKELEEETAVARRVKERLREDMQATTVYGGSSDSES